MARWYGDCVFTRQAYLLLTAISRQAQAFVALGLHRETSLHVYGKVVRPPPTNKAKWEGLELQCDYFEVIGLYAAIRPCLAFPPALIYAQLLRGTRERPQPRRRTRRDV
jgi:hypothetical protein